MVIANGLQQLKAGDDVIEWKAQWRGLGGGDASDYVCICGPTPKVFDSLG